MAKVKCFIYTIRQREFPEDFDEYQIAHINEFLMYLNCKTSVLRGF